jgi:multisite-specific tRNA:(cytosine-C5)-methyltransferase
MGRKWRVKKTRHEKDDEKQSSEKPAAPYESFEYKTNEDFEKYYKAQLIVPEADFGSFISRLLDPLPTTWRVNPLMPSAPVIAAKLEAMAGTPWVLNDGASIESPRRLPWYPAGLAWHVTSPKSDFRKHAAFKEFHQWLIAQTDAGCVTRYVI